MYMGKSKWRESNDIFICIQLSKNLPSGYITSLYNLLDNEMKFEGFECVESKWVSYDL